MSAPPRAFEALHHRGFRAFVATFMLTMMADNIEHVISYWVAFQQLHSTSLAGFAVISHWLPYLAFSFWVGGLNDRFDSRRLIQIGAAIFLCVSLGWGVFFMTGTLTVPGAMVLLALHGFAGVFWNTSSQVLLYDIVGPELLPSAVRLNATARYLGVLCGPAVGGVLLRALGPSRGIFVNACFYLPLLLWLVRAPYGRAVRGDAAVPKRAVHGFGDLVASIQHVRGLPVLTAMILLAGAASFFLGNAYQAQMPRLATDLGHGNADAAYSMLLGSDAAGALTAGILLESGFRLAKVHPSAALALAAGWATSLGAFALTRSYSFALFALFVAGFCELSFSSMTQTLVQTNAPNAERGRVLGLFSMASSGLRTFSGVTVGLVGTLIGVRASLSGACALFVTTVAGLYVLSRRRRARAA